MKKTILFTMIATFALLWQGKAQTLNQPANWPNSNWVLNTITHTGWSGPMNIEADPTVNASFSYDDHDTGSGSHDVIAAESPVIDLTSARNAGENYIKVAGDFVYNNLSALEYLAIEYWDADASAWILWYQFPNQSTQGAPINNYCSGTHQNYVTPSLVISGFSATQLSGFKYRLIYNDNTWGGNGRNWGFCFGSPTIYSQSINNPQFTLSTNPDCSNSQFYVDVEVMDLGGWNSVTVSDDQGSSTQQLSATGTVTFGPYSDGTDITFTVTSDDDPNYSSTDHIQYYCPPANDTCDGAETLTSTNSCNPTVGTNEHATDSGVSDPGCGDYNGGDIWYTFTVPNAVGDTLIVETSSVSGSDVTDTGMAVYTGDCNNLSLVECDDDGGSGLLSKVIISNPNPGDVYYVRIWEYSNSSFGQIGVCAYAPNLAVNNLTVNDFNFYPNPTQGTIRWTATETPSHLSIVNISGQVLYEVNKPESNVIDISKLPAGVYMLHVTIGDRQGTFRLIKE